MADERLVVVDHGTGEIYGAAQAPARKRMRHPYGFDWCIVSGQDYETALRAVMGSRSDLAVFAFLPRIMARNNILQVTPQVLRARLGLSLASGYRSLERLRGHWIIGEVSGYRMFNPRIAWRGQWPEDLAFAIRDWDSARRDDLEARQRVRS